MLYFLKKWNKKIGPEIALGSTSPAIAAKYRNARLQEVSAYPVRAELALVSAYPVRAELALLSHLFTKAKREWGIPVDNPVAEIDRPAPPRGRTRFLTDEEASKLLDASHKAKNKNFYYYVLTLLHTGMRASEAAGLHWNQVNLEERVIFLPDTKKGWRFPAEDRRRKGERVKEGSYSILMEKKFSRVVSTEFRVNLEKRKCSLSAPLFSFFRGDDVKKGQNSICVLKKVRPKNKQSKMKQQ